MHSARLATPPERFGLLLRSRVFPPSEKTSPRIAQTLADRRRASRSACAGFSAERATRDSSTHHGKRSTANPTRLKVTTSAASVVCSVTSHARKGWPKRLGVCEKVGCLDLLSVLPVGTTISSLQALLASGKKFSTIYADPPWAYDNEASRGAAVNHYTTMSVEEICNEPIRGLVDENAHLHLWTTNGFLREAFDVIEA
jgi:hypothetical protein